MFTKSGDAQAFVSLLASLSDTVIWLGSVQGVPDGPTDFQILYSNAGPDQHLSFLPGAPTPDSHYESATNAGQQAFADALRQVLATGVPHEQTLEDTTAKRWYQTTCTRLGAGVLVVLRYQPDYQPPIVSPPTLARLDSLINSVQIGLLLLEPVQNEAGTVVDLVYTLANDKALQILGRTRADTVGRTLLATYPGSDTFEFPGTDTGESMLDRYIRQLQEGGSSSYEFLYDRDGLHGWYWTTAQALPDRKSIVISFVDSTASKEAERDRQELLNDYERKASFLKNLNDASPNGIMVERAVRNETGQIVDFRILSANQRAATIVQSSVEQLVGRLDLELHPGLRESGNFDTYVRAIESGLPQQIDTYYNDGRLDFWALVDVRPIAEDELVITFNDVSEIRRIAQDNQQQAELLSNVLDASINGIMSFASVRDEAGQLIDFTCRIANEAACRLVGRPVEAVLDGHLRNLFPEVVQLGLFANYVATVETGTPLSTEFHIVHEGIDIFWTVSARKLNDGFVVTFSDISQLRLAAIAIEASVHRLQTVIDQSQTAIALLAPVYDEARAIVTFQYTLVNQTLADYFDKTPSDLIGSSVSDWFTDFKKDDDSFTHYQRVFLTGQPTRFDLHYDADGLNLWLDVMATRMGNEVLISFSNYTSLKQAQQQLESSVVDLQRSNRNLEQFAYVASHDLQEPLRKIRTFGNMIQATYRDTLGTEGTAMLDRMQSAAARMQTLIRDVLAYSRITTQRDKMGLVSLQQLIDDVQTDLEATITEQQARLQVDPLPVVQGDAIQLRQLFQNLISNALKFQRPGMPPVLTLTTHIVLGRDTTLNVLSVDEDRRFHQIELTDNGIGFAPEHADRIFQVFQRLHGRSQYEGTGIGLAIVEKVVQNHQGYIEAEGRPNDGATFRLLLPV